MIEGSARCPQCNNHVWFDANSYTDCGSEIVICDDCGAELEIEYRVYADTDKVTILERGTNHDEEEDHEEQ